MFAVPAPVQGVVAKHGRSFAPAAIATQRALYAELHGAARAPHALRDVPYGPHERQRFDLHADAPLEAGTRRPIVLFVHGGGFVGGARRDPVQPFYENVGTWAARQGWIGATMSYRLAPEHRWPAGAQDVGAAVRDLRALAPFVGGDPDRIVLFGHSAGAAHVAGQLAGHGGPVAPGIAAVVLQSGIYDPATADDEIAEMAAMYYGGSRTSAVEALAALSVPLWLGVGEHDPLTFHRQARLIDAPRVAAGHSHFSSIYALGLIDGFPNALAAFLSAALSTGRR